MWTAIKAWAGGINWAAVAAVAVVVAVSTTAAWIYGKGEASARVACAEGAVSVIEQKESEHAKIETKVRSLPADRLADEYSRWVQP